MEILPSELNVDRAEGYIYSFHVERKYPQFARLPENMQATIEMHIVNVIFESFVEPADHDYLAARSLGINGLYRSFFWSAAQTVEKYLKAFLLLNGVSIKNNSHGLKSLVEKSENVDPEFGNIDIRPHPELVFLPHIESNINKFSLTEFVQILENQGSAFNRYNDVGAIYNTGHLFALDTLAHYLRGKMGVPSLKKSFRDLSDSFLSTLYDNNPYCAPAGFVHSPVPSKLFPIVHSMSSTRLAYLLKNPGSNTMAINWLDAHMRIDKDKHLT